jgi:hypothetical protein
LGDGYYVANSRDEYEDFKKSYLSATYRKLEIASMMDVTADHRWGAKPKQTSPMQVGMFGGVQ